MDAVSDGGEMPVAMMQVETVEDEDKLLHFEDDGKESLEFGDAELALEALNNLQRVQSHFKGDTKLARELASRAAFRPPTSLLLPSFVSKQLTAFFQKLAVVVLAYPWAFVIIALALLAYAVPSTFLLLQYEGDAEELWTPVDMEGYSTMKRFQGDFPVRAQTCSAVFSASGRNILTHAFLAALFKIQAVVDEKANFQGLCFRAYADAPCPKTCLLEVWRYNESLAMQDTDLLGTVSNYFKDDRPYGSSQAVMDTLSVVWEGGTIQSVRAAACKWEYTNQFPDQTEKTDDAFVAIFRKEWHRLMPNVTSIPNTPTSISKEIARIVQEDISLVAVSIVLVLVFCTLVLGDMTLVGSRLLLGMSGIVLMLLAFVIGLGLLVAVGVKITPVTPLVLFVLIGIGVDDMIIIVDNFNAHLFIEDQGRRMSHSLGVSGPAITLTTVTDVLAFALGSMATMPAVRSFTITALFVVLVDFFLQVTLFIIVLQYDEKRVSANRMDFFFCVVLPDRYATIRDLYRMITNKGSRVKMSNSTEDPSTTGPGGAQQTNTEGVWGDGGSTAHPPIRRVSTTSEEMPLTTKKSMITGRCLSARNLAKSLSNTTSSSGGLQRLQTTRSILRKRSLRVGSSLARTESHPVPDDDTNAIAREMEELSLEDPVVTESLSLSPTIELSPISPAVRNPLIYPDIPTAALSEGTLESPLAIPAEPGGGANKPVKKVAIASLPSLGSIKVTHGLQPTQCASLLDILRMESGATDGGTEEPESGRVARFVKQYYAPAVTSTKGRVLVIAVFLVWVAFCGAHATSIKEGLSLRSTLPANSYMRDFMDVNDDFFAGLPGGFMVVIDDPRVDWADPRTIVVVDILKRRLLEHPSIRTLSTWLHDMYAWREAKMQLGLEGWEELEEFNNETFPRVFKLFSDEYPQVKRVVVVHPETGRIARCVFPGQQFVADDTDGKTRDMQAARSIFATWKASSGVDGYVIADWYAFTDGDRSIAGLIYNNLLVSGVGVLFALLFFVSPYIAVLITINVGLIDLSILGWMFLTDVSLSPVSYIVMAMSIGISVDYCAHIGIAFANCRINRRHDVEEENNRDVIHPANVYVCWALEEIGASVLAGGGSTLLGVIALSGASSETFLIFFKMLFAAVFFGMMHGFVFFPAVLASLPKVLVERTVIRPSL